MGKNKKGRGGQNKAAGGDGADSGPGGGAPGAQGQAGGQQGSPRGPQPGPRPAQPGGQQGGPRGPQPGPRPAQPGAQGHPGGQQGGPRGPQPGPRPAQPVQQQPRPVQPVQQPPGQQPGGWPRAPTPQGAQGGPPRGWAPRQPGPQYGPPQGPAGPRPRAPVPQQAGPPPGWAPRQPAPQQPPAPVQQVPTYEEPRQAALPEPTGGQPPALPVQEETVEQQVTKVTQAASQLSVSEPAGPVGGGGDESSAGDKEDADSAWIVTKKDREIFDKEFPPKKAPGTAGKSVTLEVNHYPIRVSGNRRIFMYDVTIKPIPDAKNKKPPEQIKSKKVCRAIWSQYMAKYGKTMDGLIPAYDGFKIAYVVEPGLPDSEHEVSYREDADDETRTFTVTLKKAGKGEDAVINLIDIFNYAQGRQKEPPLRAIAAVNAFFAHVPSLIHLTVGRKFLSSDDRDWLDLTGGKVGRTGFSMTVREGSAAGWTLHLSVNTVAGVFAKEGNAADLAAEILGCRNPGEIMQRGRNVMNIRKTLQDHFERLKVKMSHNNRRKVVTGISRKAARDISFMHGEGPKARQMSLVEYYKVTYKVNVRFPDLPCFHIGPVKNNTFIPMELCYVLPNQSRMGLLSERQTTQLLNALTMHPEKRFQGIARDVARLAKDTDPLLKQLGMQIDANKQYIPGRVIPAPNIEYRQRQIARPSLGSWRTDAKHKYFQSPTGTNGIPWGCAWSDQSGVDPKAIQEFAMGLQRQARSSGLELGMPISIGPIRQPHQLKDNPKIKGLALLVVILPENKCNPGGFREDLKRIAETKLYELNLMTQCVRPQHFYAPGGRAPNAFNNMYLGNLLLKINTKLGGVNSAPMIDPVVMQYIKDSQTLILGADVTHAPPGSKHPSVAAVLGSVDRIGLRYTAHIRVQDVREEFIIDMKGIMKKCLMNYYMANGKRKPNQIIFFRDGVGEGAFKKVRSYEIAKIQEACVELEKGYYPPITFVIVQKRHQTRFKPTDNNATRSGNVLPGTVVDTHITSPRLYDFYMVSHEGIKGTSRPTHYWVVWDDYGFQNNELQALTYYLCHCYSRCNRSVSIPAPTYYAHHVATRAKGYIKDKLNPDNMTVASGSSGESGIDLLALNGAVELHQGMENKMFFV